jgi:hypothetical protein
VSDRVEEDLLTRQAMALARRSGEPLIEALEDILKIPAVSQPLGPMGGPHQEEESLLFPSFDYYLDESDPYVVVVLRRQDGSYVAAFSAIGATREGIVEAARGDYAALVEANAAFS